MAIYFISDLHLDHNTPAIEAGLKKFLTTIAKDAEALYILGDLYDAWVGDDDDSAMATNSRNLLKSYTQTGIPTYFIEGNRDFLIRQKFLEDTGIQQIQDLHIIDLYGEKALLMHGDTLCTEDYDYQQFRQAVRTEQWQNQVLTMSLQQRRMMAKTMRTQSTSLNSIKLGYIMDVTEAEVHKVMRSHSVNLLIHGHTHRPAIHNFVLDDEPSERIVLGDWAKEGWYLKVQEGKKELLSFELPVLERVTDS